MVNWALALGIICLYDSAHAQTCPRSSWYENDFARHRRISSIVRCNCLQLHDDHSGDHTHHYTYDCD